MNDRHENLEQGGSDPGCVQASAAVRNTEQVSNQQSPDMVERVARLRRFIETRKRIASPSAADEQSLIADLEAIIAEASLLLVSDAALEADLRQLAQYPEWAVNDLRAVDFRLALVKITEHYPPDTLAGQLAADALAKHVNRFAKIGGDA